MSPQDNHPSPSPDTVCLHIAGFSAWAMAHWWKSSASKSVGLAVCAAGRVFSCSPSLKRRGVELGDSVERVRALVPQAEFHLRDVEIEKAVWDHVLARLYSLTPRILPISDPKSPSSRPLGIWENGAWALLQNPDMNGLSHLAGDLDAQIGSAPARAWCMLAAAFSKPGCLTSIPPGMVMPFLRQAPVSLLQHVGFCPDLTARLELFGLKAVAHLTSLTRRHLSAQFGNDGETLFDFLHPDEEEPPVPNYEPCVLSAQYDFEWPVFEPADLQPALSHLLEQLIAQLRGYSARHIALKLKGGRRELNRESSRILKNPTNRPSILTNAANTLLQQTLFKKPSTRSQTPCGSGVQSIVLELSGLSLLPPEQATLFRAKPTISPLVKSMDTRFPGKLLRPVHSHADPFFSEEEYRFESVC